MRPRSLLFALLVFAAGAAAGAALRRPAAGAPSAAPAQQETYYCPMHPSYRSDHPGDCPVCNMKLIPLEAGEALPDATPVEGHATVTIRPERLQLLGVQSERVARVPFALELRAAGRVAPDERTLFAVSLKYGGWIEELLVNATGQTVAAGEPLFRIYSPELFEAQRAYLLARAAQSAGGDALGRELAESARQKLQLWDTSDEDLRALEARGEAERLATVRARSAGVVLRREAVAGARVEAGTTLYELADLSRVWILASIPARDLALVPVGAEASIELESQPERRLPGRVAYVYPTVDEETRTGRVRIEAENADGSLKPGLYATVSISADLGEELVIDASAVLDTGRRKLVFVDLGEGRFEPREVELARRSGGRAVVVSGLEEGERVLTSGNFLIDSESRLKAALAQHASGAHEHH